MSSDDTRDSDTKSNRSYDHLPLDRRDYLRYTSAAAAGSLAITGGAAAQSNDNKNNRRGSGSEDLPTNLCVEYDRQPNNLAPDGNPPRFFWELSTGQRGTTQTAYRLLVADSASSIRNGKGNIWDSGKVESPRSTGIEYSGSALDADTTYYWMVRIWNQAGSTSDWSAPSRFSTALSNTDDAWEGSWIGKQSSSESQQPEADSLNPAPLMRREMEFDKEIEEGRLHVSGLGFYELYINGEQLGDRVLDPGRTDYENTILYATYDVGDKLEEQSVIGAVLGRGRYGELADNPWNWDDAPWWSDPELLLQLNVEFVDGTSTSIVSDETWKVANGPTLRDELYEGEIYDATKEISDWTEPTFDQSDWEDVRRDEGAGGDLQPQRVQPIKITESLTPEAVSEPEPDVYVFDLGQMIAGWPELRVDGSAGETVNLTLGEQLDDDGTVSEVNYGGMEHGRYSYTLDGEGLETWSPRFSYMGFRYIQVEDYPGKPTLDDITGELLHTDIEQNCESDFECSNDLLNQIHENTRWALVNNHHSLPEDTPTFEKNGWTADAHATAETAIYNFDMARLYQKWVRDMRDAQLESGEVPVIVPTSDWSYEGIPGWPAVQGPVPAWDAAYFIMPWLMYRFYGDKRALHQQYAAMKEYLGWFEGYFEGYIPTMGLGDWQAPGETELSISSTAFYYREADILERTARLFDRDDEADEFENLKHDIRNAFNEEFYDEEAGYYGTDDVDTYVQTSNVLPLAFGMVPDEREESVAASLAEDVMEERDGHLDTGVLGTKHILPVLTEHGYHDVAYTIATQTSYPSWGHWIENDITALLESWPLDARSRNHHFFGSIGEWFYEYIAGIREPVEPGFSHIEIAPELPAEMEWAEATTDTVRGQIRSHWERTEPSGRSRTQGELTLDVTIPGNSTATVKVPTLGSEKVRVRESRRTIWINGHQVGRNHPGVESVRREDDQVVVEVGSGDYVFEVERLG